MHCNYPAQPAKVRRQTFSCAGAKQKAATRLKRDGSLQVVAAVWGNSKRLI
jgi:hypothetical protein